MNIHHIEWMKFNFPAKQDGIGVDKKTGLPASEPDPKATDEEAVELSIKFSGEIGERVFPNRQAMGVYEEVWKLLNDAQRDDQNKRAN